MRNLPLPWLVQAVDGYTTDNVRTRLEQLAAAYHMVYQHAPDQKHTCAACTALDPKVIVRR